MNVAIFIFSGACVIVCDPSEGSLTSQALTVVACNYCRYRTAILICAYRLSVGIPVIS